MEKSVGTFRDGESNDDERGGSTRFFFGGTLGKRASEHANALTENNTIGADQFLDNRQAPAFAGRWVPLDKIQFSRESSHLFLYFLLSPFFFKSITDPLLEPFF